MISSPDKTSSTSTLEDRHFLSDPRPVPGLELPTWEVDIHREGVEQPILTLRVDKNILPPRKKKKKTLWKLPDSIETNPKFGEQDRRRILELFREKKKELKKLKNKQRAYRRASSIEAMQNGGAGISSTNRDAEKANQSNGPTPESKNHPPENGENKTPTSTVNNDGRDDSSPSPPGFAKLSISESDNKSTSSTPTASNSNAHSSPLKPAPPGLPSKTQQPSKTTNGFSSPTSPPPGLQQSQHNPSQLPSKPPLTPLPPPGLMNGHVSPKPEMALPPRAVGPSFVLPPEAPPGASMGKFVTETYYLLLRNGLIRDLDAYYYTPSSDNGGGVDMVYKAVTVGGAHAVCSTAQDRLVQLNTFAGCEMRIKGVQQQSTVGKGILVLITGVNIRTDGHIQQQQLPFCHTLILKPVLTTTAASFGVDPTASAMTTPTIGYQILNDNLVILTGDE